VVVCSSIEERRGGGGSVWWSWRRRAQDLYMVRAWEEGQDNDDFTEQTHGGDNL